MRQTLNQSWKFLASKIHQPLALNRRESQKLLAGLNESFQRKFDRQYPQDLDTSEPSPDYHIKSVLQSPLFSSIGVQSPQAGKAKIDNHYDTRNVTDLESALEHPVEWFKQQVSAGTADLERAAFALKTQHHRSLASAFLDHRKSMASEGIGSVVNNWLWSSGHSDRLDFVRNYDFVRRFIPTLVVEGLYKQVWEWLQRLQMLSARQAGETATPETRQLQSDADRFFLHVLRSETRHGYGLQSAIHMFLTSLHVTMPGSSPLVAQKFFISGGRYLVDSLARGKESEQIGDPVIANFLLSVRRWSSGTRRQAYQALISLSHPREPDTSIAQELLIRFLSTDTFILDQIRPIIIRVGLKTVEVLLTKGSVEEAADLMKSLQTKFETELGEGTTPATGISAEERSAFRSLSLQFAT
ncbi:MAG: hypothetical protein Q9174_005820 [Haloplaca sp. 1 TL-2023]